MADKGRIVRTPLVLVGLVLAGLLTDSPLVAQELGQQAIRQIQAILADKARWTPAERKLATPLLMAHRHSRGRAMIQGLDSFPRTVARARVGWKGMVVVDLKAVVTEDLLRAIADVGGEVISSHPTYGAVRARVPIRRIDVLAALPEVRFVRPKARFRLNIGSQNSEGDIAHAADAARVSLSVDGGGARVCVLSAGVDSLAARQATSDFPPTCAPTPAPGPCVAVLPGEAGAGDWGTAMLEIVHDLAPGAQLFFANADAGIASVSVNIQALYNTYGCDVMVDDVTYFSEGAFQDGPIAQAVNSVTASGALYFSSAGNSGRLSAGTSGTWEGDFVDSGTAIPVGIDGLGYPQRPVHSFNGLTEGSAATSDQLTADAPDAITLQWADPWGGATNDYDLFLLSSDLQFAEDFSIDDQECPPPTPPGNCSTEPFEIMDALAPAGINGERIVVVKWSGDARALRVETHGGQLSIATDGAVYGHNAAESTVSVAAVDVSTAGGGAFTGGAANPVEAYSSDGPRHMFFNPNGTAITPGNLLFATNGGRELQKPDITAADCVTTTTPGFIPFCGTSAAAPHAAAIAALLLSTSPAPAPSAVAAAMAATALDVDPAGVDQDSGSGIVVADRLNSVADVAVTMTGPASVALGADVVYTITVTHHGLGTASSVQVANPTPAGLTFVSNTGDCTTTFPCDLGSLDTGQSRAITATFAVPLDYAGPSPFTNTAAVSSLTTDPVPGNNSSSVLTTITFPVDLSITKTGPPFATRGANLTYTIMISNAGPGTASSVEVTDPTPAGLTFVSNTGDCATAFPCALGSIPSSENRTITSTFGVPAGYDVSSSIVNAAAVSSSTLDTDTTNNTDSAISLFGAYYTLVPCRLVDTRVAPWMPALHPGEERTFLLAGSCGIPTGAAALSVNLTVTTPTAPGNLRLFPADVAAPLVSSINFVAGLTRANNAVVPASADGTVAITVKNSSTGTVEFILDVNGYFE